MWQRRGIVFASAGEDTDLHRTWHLAMGAIAEEHDESPAGEVTWWLVGGDRRPVATGCRRFTTIEEAYAELVRIKSRATAGGVSTLLLADRAGRPTFTLVESESESALAVAVRRYSSHYERGRGAEMALRALRNGTVPLVMTTSLTTPTRPPRRR